MTLSNQDIARFLRQIPQSNQDKKSLQHMHDLRDNYEIASLYGVAQLLHMFGMIILEPSESIEQSSVKASSQTAKYTLISLADYIDRDELIIRDWKTRGVHDNMLANGATFLHALEVERDSRFDNVTPSRYVKVAQVLIKRINPESGEHELLFQFDKNADQYQLIGGRWSEIDGDDLKATIIREIDEELPLNPLPYPEAYQLQCLINAMTIEGSISSTFGALTHYTFWIYHMRGLAKPLALQPEDRWLPIQQVLDGVVKVENIDYTFTNSQIFRRMDTNIISGLMGLATSFAFSQT